MAGRWKLLSLVAVAALVATSCNYVYGPFLARVDGVVVLTGADLGVAALGLDPDRGVAYRWDDDTAGWVQIPVQVDERVVIDLGVKPNNNTTAGVPGTVYGSGNLSGVTELVYCRPRHLGRRRLRPVDR